MENSVINSKMLPIMGAQFLSALADNTLFFALLALLKAMSSYADWNDSVLQSTFVLAYIVLSPIVGAVADRFPKGRVMMLGNGLKLLGVFILLLQVHPFIAYAVVGVGAAIYSPAKFGILGEVVHGRLLVKANSLIEASTIAAILAGTFIGGKLAEYDATIAILITAGLYAVAVVVNYFIPRLPAAHPEQTLRPLVLVRDFKAAVCYLMKDKTASFAILGTSLFWGAAATLRLLLFAWIPIALSMGSTVATSATANANGVVGIGVVIGAGLAGYFLTIQTAYRALWAGLGVGVCILYMSVQTNLYMIGGLLFLIGAFGGFFIVPLNALIQNRGLHSVGAGHAVAIQNFFENAVMIIMLSLYFLASYSGVAIVPIIVGFGAVFTLGIIFVGHLAYQTRRAVVSA